MTLETSAARDRLLRTAHALFYRDGIRATGIDRVIAEAAVTKVTFYRHFPSKDVLVRAFLDYRHDLWMGWFVDALGRHGGASRGLSALADAMQEWFTQPGFRGCAFINAVAETGGDPADTRAAAAAHKREMGEVIRALLPADDTSADRTAAMAALAVDGAIVQAQIGAPDNAAADLRALLAALEN
ncbi:helix-turn-helix domain-containing protein [Xylophilus sp. GOD-11R]|uniref:TetR/AcrR family transcriptional regulator n=1 Tax=Xylophilus sp. GOD-11R TaxID=3089814 RepID=UPI00298C7835|nr:helix-turn-helix domain-containing protein [Xylophilus sp. GOD-11R]WPB57700.1 helix-turn-helix domain-containing protein [Xylophilus sp. GOD-11R]